MWSFQMRYMIPIRRASASSLPSASGAVSRARSSRTVARSALEPAFIVQSMARPSLCSEAPPERHARTDVCALPPSKRRSSQRASSSVPG